MLVHCGDQGWVCKSRVVHLWWRGWKEQVVEGSDRCYCRCSACSPQGPDLGLWWTHWLIYQDARAASALHLRWGGGGRHMSEIRPAPEICSDATMKVTDLQAAGGRAVHSTWSSETLNTENTKISIRPPDIRVLVRVLVLLKLPQLVNYWTKWKSCPFYPVSQKFPWWPKQNKQTCLTMTQHCWQ